MNQTLRWPVCLFFVLLSEILYAQEFIQGGCDVTFSLFGADTICHTSEPYNIPPALPFGGTYSGPGVSADWFDPAITGPGQFTITYTYTDEFCTASSSVVMTVIQGVGLEFVGDFEICLGDSAVISSSDGSEYTWESGDKDPSEVFFPDTTFTSYATGNDAIGCPSLTSFVVRVYDYPILSVTGETQLCAGETTTLYVTSDYPWEWFDGSIEDSLVISANESFDVTVTSVNGICDTTAVIPISILPYPELIVEIPESVCEGDTIHIVPSGGVLYKGPNGFFDVSQDYVPESSSSITVQAFNENNCVTTQIFDVDVLQVPTVDLLYDDSLCFGSTSIMNATGGILYLWFDLTADSTITTGESPSISFTPLNSTDVQLTGINDVGCGDNVFFHVEVLPLPELTIEPLSPVCAGAVTSLQASGGSTYLWNGVSVENPFFSIWNDTTEIFLDGYSQYGCMNTISYLVETHPVPVVSITGTSVICDGYTNTLTANGASSYVWFNDETTNSIDVVATSDSIFSVTGTSEFGCTDFTNYMVSVLPSPSLEIFADDTICAGAFLHLQAVTDGELLWFNGLTASEIDVQVFADDTIYAYSTGPNGCIREFGFESTVTPFPVIDIVGDLEICAGEETNITASGPAELSWNTGDQDGQITVSPLFTTNYYVTGTDDNDCSVTIPVNVLVHQLPYTYFVFNIDTVCNTGPAITWQANPAGGDFSGDGVSNNQFNPFQTTIGVNTVTYSFTDEFGCTSASSDDVIVELCTDISENELASLVVYPNPASDFIWIVLDSGISEISAFDTRGALVMNEKNILTGKYLMDVSQLPQGLFEVVAVGRNGEFHHRSVVVR